MFLVNSRLGLFSAATSVAPLLPKLRGHFAEFLNKGSPARLRILSSPTCVGLRYRRLTLPSSFSRQREINGFATNLRSTSQTILIRRTSLPYRLSACPGSTSNPVRLSFCVPASVIHVLAVQEYLPVVHHLQLYALGLGPDLPWVDEPCPGNLRLSTAKILTWLSLTHTGILSCIQSTQPFDHASARIHCSPTDHKVIPWLRCKA